MSDIPYDRLRTLSARKLIGALFRDGFSLVRQAGSHQQFRHRDGRMATVTGAITREKKDFPHIQKAMQFIEAKANPA